MALAAAMLKVVYHMLKEGTRYRELGDNYQDEWRKDAQIKYHREQLDKLLRGDLLEAKSA